MRIRSPDHRARTSELGFKRIELAAIVVVVFILAALVVVGATHLTERNRRARCRSNLGQVSRAVLLYAGDYNNRLPDCTRRNPRFFGSVFPWDLNENLVLELDNRGAGRRFLYCPSNKDQNNETTWNFGAARGTQIRILGYAFLLNGNVPNTPVAWRTNVVTDGGGNPSKVELVLDAVINEGGHFTKIEATQRRRTSHVVPFTSKPAGANIAFEDGHVDWREFKLMQNRFFSRGLNHVKNEPMAVDWYY
jgi:hypothetical protein